MKNLVFVVLAVTAMAGCKHDKTNSKTGSAAEPAPPPKKPEPIKNEPPVAVAGVPTECTDYKAAVERLAMCTTLDVATRAKLRHDYNTAAEQWKAMGSAEKAGLSRTCRDGLDILNATAKTPCGW